MNDLVQLLCISVSVTGGVYCLSLLWDCRRRARTAKEPINSSRGSARRKSACARVNWLCQLLLTAAFLTVAVSLLAGFAYQAASDFSRDRAGSQQQRCSFETIAIPGYPPMGVDYDTSQPGQPIIGIECARKPISDDQLRGLLRETPKLVYLNLAYTHITDDALCELSRAPKLHMLGLQGTRIGDLKLQDLAKLKSLEVLRLNHTKITDKGLRSLADLKNLRELSLCDTAVTDAGLHWLRGLDKLELLDLENTGVTQEGVNRLKGTLPGVTINLQRNEDQP